jgi:hypothetical protein
MPKYLAFKELIRNRATVDKYKLARPAREAVDFLAN